MLDAMSGTVAASGVVDPPGLQEHIGTSTESFEEKAAGVLDHLVQEPQRRVTQHAGRVRAGAVSYLTAPGPTIDDSCLRSLPAFTNICLCGLTDNLRPRGNCQYSKTDMYKSGNAVLASTESYYCSRLQYAMNTSLPLLW